MPPRAGSNPRILSLLLLLLLVPALAGAARTERLLEVFEDSYVAACVITKDDNLDIREWIEYHRRLGTGRFYFFDHNSTIPQINDMQDYVKSGLVEYKFFARTKFRDDLTPSAQHYVYNLCLSHYGSRHRWMMFLDTDEFIVIKGGRPLPELLRGYEDFGGVGLNWLLYGSAKHETRPRGGILENYDQCNPNRSENRHMKAIVQPARTVRCLSPHHFLLRGGYACVSTDRAAIPGGGPFVHPFRFDVAYIAHFFTKSREDWARKLRRGAGDHTRQVAKHFEIYNRGDGPCPRVEMYEPPPAQAR